MRYIAVVLLCLLPTSLLAEKKGMKLTPVLIVDEIEKSLPFWVDRLGFTKTVEVPEGNRLGFVILVKDSAEVMLQSWESVNKDVPGLFDKNKTMAAGLFVVVDDFADIRKRLAGANIVVAERVTFYGMREIGMREPGGHIVIFAAEEKK